MCFSVFPSGREEPSVTERQLNFLVADDHPLIRDAYTVWLEACFGCVSVDAASSFENLVALLESDTPYDAILLDLKMPGVNGFLGLLYTRVARPNVPVVVVSATDDSSTIRICSDLGSSSFVSKSEPPEAVKRALQEALKQTVTQTEVVTEEAIAEIGVVQRLKTLTKQQVRVLNLLIDGMLNKQMAHELSITEATVKSHVSNLMWKLNVDTRTRVVILVQQISGLTLAV